MVHLSLIKFEINKCVYRQEVKTLPELGIGLVIKDSFEKFRIYPLKEIYNQQLQLFISLP